MSIVLQTIRFKLSGKPYEISLWVDDQEMGTLEAAFHNWQIRTDDHTDYDFAQYITSKGHFALTVKEYDHREQLRPYFDRLENGVEMEVVIRQILQQKGMLDELDEIINSYYEDSDQNPKDPRSKKIGFIKEDYWNFGDYLVAFPLQEEKF